MNLKNHISKLQTKKYPFVKNGSYLFEKFKTSEVQVKLYFCLSIFNMNNWPLSLQTTAH